MEKTFRSIDNFFNQDQFADLQLFFEDNVAWEFGSQSDRWRLPFGHWNHEFLNAHPRNQSSLEEQIGSDPRLEVVSSLWKRIKSKVLPNHELIRCYANAHTYGVEGYPHVDHRSPGNYSTIVYVNPYWTHEWAGETVLINEFGDIIHSSLPKPGRIIVFDGRITHAARSVSRRCPALRVALVFKSKLKDVGKWDVPQKYVDYLKENGADKIDHSEDYSLLEHLVGTYQILKEHEAPDYLCLAGLFHSIYGTSVFRNVTVGKERRGEIQALIGRKAEEIVFAFSALDRPKLFEDTALKQQYDWKDSLDITFDKDQACDDLLRIECANILDQKKLDHYPNLAEYAQKINMLGELGI